MLKWLLCKVFKAHRWNRYTNGYHYQERSCTRCDRTEWRASWPEYSADAKHPLAGQWREVCRDE